MNNNKGKITRADYIDFDRAMSVGKKLLNEDKKRILGLYILVSVNTGLRASDVLKLHWEDLQGHKLILKEQKTKKTREIALNSTIQELYRKFSTVNSGLIFISQKKTVFRIQQINKLLKEAFKREAKSKNISSHSLRKCMGRRVWENDNQSERALVYLMELFNHSSLAITKRYLGIRQEELDDIYMNL